MQSSRRHRHSKTGWIIHTRKNREKSSEKRLENVSSQLRCGWMEVRLFCLLYLLRYCRRNSLQNFQHQTTRWLLLKEDSFGLIFCVLCPLVVSGEHRKGCNTTDGNASKVEWRILGETKSLKQKQQWMDVQSDCVKLDHVTTGVVSSSEEFWGDFRSGGNEELWRTLLRWRAGKSSSCPSLRLTRLNNDIQQHLYLSLKAQFGSWHEGLTLLNVKNVALFVPNQQETC